MMLFVAVLSRHSNNQPTTNVLAQDKHADILIARRRHCKYMTALDEMTDEQVRQELENLYTLFPVSTHAEHVLQPHVDAIRTRCRLNM